MKYNVAEILTGAGVLALTFILCIVFWGQSSVQNGWPLYLLFDRADGIEIGAPVKIAGIKLGAVQSTEFDQNSYRARVTVRIKDNIQIPNDSNVEIVSEGLFGGKYINIVPGGSATMLAPGSVIGHTQSSMNLEALLGKMLFSKR